MKGFALRRTLVHDIVMDAAPVEELLCCLLRRMLRPLHPLLTASTSEVVSRLTCLCGLATTAILRSSAIVPTSGWTSWRAMHQEQRLGEAFAVESVASHTSQED